MLLKLLKATLTLGLDLPTMVNEVQRQKAQRQQIPNQYLAGVATVLETFPFIPSISIVLIRQRVQHSKLVFVCLFVVYFVYFISASTPPRFILFFNVIG